MTDHARIFAPQYRQRSGPGSTAAATTGYRAFLETFLREHQVSSVLDLGCGDGEIMSRIDLGGAAYLGVDVIAERIADNRRRYPRLAFEISDFRTRPIEPVDLVIVKDVLQHWTTREVLAWLQVLLASDAKRALITNCNYGPTVNTEIRAGRWRALDLTRPPFSIGEVVLRWDVACGTRTLQKDTVLIELGGAGGA